MLFVRLASRAASGFMLAGPGAWSAGARMTARYNARSHSGPEKGKWPWLEQRDRGARIGLAGVISVILGNGVEKGLD